MRFYIILLFIGIWSGLGHSMELSYDEIPGFIKSNSRKVKSAQSQMQANEAMTGFLQRSFLPEMNLFAGSEHFDSKGLGKHNSDYYGVEARVNVFNGMRDYWSEQKRKKDVEASQIEGRLLQNDEVYQARKLFLEVVRADTLLKIYRDNQSLVATTEPKVRSKVRGGVISKSDLLTLRLISTNIKEEMEQIERERNLDIAKLRSILGIADELSVVVSDSFFALAKIDPSVSSLGLKSLQAKSYAIKEEALKTSENSESNLYLPSVDFYANYVRQPYSEREIDIDENRTEFKAGIVATWKVGEILEKKSNQEKYRAQAKAYSHLKDFHQEQAKLQVEVLKNQMAMLENSIENLKTEIGASQNYFKQISDEYLRGIKSTSDLTGALNEVAQIRVKHISLLIQLKLTQAQITSIIGEA